MPQDYRSLNESFSDRTLIYHLGIDAGFFAEYKYMVNAILYCLENKVKFKLYSADANFGYGSGEGWNEFFKPFCDTVTDDFNRKYNLHHIPSTKEVVRRVIARQKPGLLKWKLKCAAYSLVGHRKAKRLYGPNTLLNSDIPPMRKPVFSVPELGIDGDYTQAYRAIKDITWRFNDSMQAARDSLTASLNLPEKYIGCQVRGGDKITEVSLLSPDKYMAEIERHTSLKDVFVLTDDYSIFEYLRDKYPAFRFYTLCAPSEAGYVNQAFTKTDPKKKHDQMCRFLTSMDILLHAQTFVGSITTGPSVFAMTCKYPDVVPVDYDKSDLKNAFNLSIEERGWLASNYLKTHSGRS